MARGNARAPSQNAYRGSIGQTQTETVHVTNQRGDLVAATVYTTIDAVNNPELVELLYANALNTVKLEGATALALAVPVVYHDPAAELMVLVLGEAHRHREIEERLHLLERLRADDSAIPAYVKDFAVVFGAGGLRAYIEGKANQALASGHETRASDRKRVEIQSREADLERLRRELEHSQSELKRKQTEHEIAVAEVRSVQLELQRDRHELERMRAEARQRVIAAAVQVPSESRPARSPDGGGRHEVVARTAINTPEGGSPFDAEAATRIDVTIMARAAGMTHFDAGAATGGNAKQLAAVEVDDEPTSAAAILPGSDPLTTETREVAADHADPWLAAVAPLASSMFEVQDGRVRLALVVDDRVANALRGNLDVRILLHRMSSYPLVVMLIGSPAALRMASSTELAVLALDVASDTDRAVMTALASRFDLVVDVIANGHPVRRVQVTAPLADNVAYIVRAADDHLLGLAAGEGAEPSYQRASDLVLGAGYDLLGVAHAEAAEFREDKLAAIDTAQQLRRALAIARRFSRTSREDYLACARGFPLVRWRELRRGVLERAVTWGMWMGPELAQIAVSEGLARSRRELIVKLDAGFDVLRRNHAAFDIDADAADDNANAIAEEARAVGVELRRGANGTIKSEDVSVVSGSIDKTPTSGPPNHHSTEELIALLDHKPQRMVAATELCDRAEPHAAAAVIAAVNRMSRAEAVRILGKSVKFGAAAAAPLIEGLRSSKAYLRHGCALALALLRTEHGTHAVIDLLFSEPTEIWREIARAIGQIGPTALMPLASQFGKLSDAPTPAMKERVAWAMAHVGVRGGKPALDQLAAGQSMMAPVAQTAVALMSNSARDEVRVLPGQVTRDVTVNRAFSRRFFEALETDRPDVAHAALRDLEASGPLELVAEEDLIVEEELDDEAVLDESDLIQT